MSERRTGLLADEYRSARLARPIDANEQRIEISGDMNFLVGDDLEFASTGERVTVTDVVGNGSTLVVRRGAHGTTPAAVSTGPAPDGLLRVVGNDRTDRTPDPGRGWRDSRDGPTRTDRYLVVLQGNAFRYTTIATYVVGRGWCGSDEVGPSGELIRSWRELPRPL